MGKELVSGTAVFIGTCILTLGYYGFKHYFRKQTPNANPLANKKTTQDTLARIYEKENQFFSGVKKITLLNKIISSYLHVKTCTLVNFSCHAWLHSVAGFHADVNLCMNSLGPGPCVGHCYCYTDSGLQLHLHYSNVCGILRRYFPWFK